MYAPFPFGSFTGWLSGLRNDPRLNVRQIKNSNLFCFLERFFAPLPCGGGAF